MVQNVHLHVASWEELVNVGLEFGFIKVTFDLSHNIADLMQVTVSFYSLTNVFPHGAKFESTRVFESRGNIIEQ